MVAGEDLKEALADRAATAKSRRARETEIFARIPYERGLGLYGRIDNPAWVVLIELDHMVLAQRGKNPVLFWSKRLHAMGLTGHVRIRAMQQLEEAGVIKIERRGKGHAHLVTYVWLPLKD
jgi:hypothetical protein